MGNIVEKNICGHIIKFHTSFDAELNVMHDFLSLDITKNTRFEKLFAEYSADASITVDGLIIKERGNDGLSFEHFYKYSESARLIDGLWTKITEYQSDYVYISGDDLLDYGSDDLLDTYADSTFTDAEKEALYKSLVKQSKIAVHRDYYDADDNKWKNY